MNYPRIKISIIFLTTINWFCENSNLGEDDIVDYGLVINEINYNSVDNFDTGDWIEIYNNSDNSIDLSNWLLKDDNDYHIFTIPQNTFLSPDKYIVFCKDTTKLKSLYPLINNIYGDFDFGFGSDNDIVRIFDSNGVLVDIVEYLDESPWPLLPDGGGATLELKNPSLDNSLHQNWLSSDGYGTPGQVNSIYDGDQ